MQTTQNFMIFCHVRCQPGCHLQKHTFLPMVDSSTVQHVFHQHDSDDSGMLEPHELPDALDDCSVFVDAET